MHLVDGVWCKKKCENEVYKAWSVNPSCFNKNIIEPNHLHCILQLNNTTGDSFYCGPVPIPSPPNNWLRLQSKILAFASTNNDHLPTKPSRCFTWKTCNAIRSILSHLHISLTINLRRNSETLLLQSRLALVQDLHIHICTCNCIDLPSLGDSDNDAPARIHFRNLFKIPRFFVSDLKRPNGGESFEIRCCRIYCDEY